MTRPSGIMEICKAREQKPVSAEALELVARIQTKARAFVAAKSPRPSGASPHSPRSGKGQYKGVDGRMHEAGSMCPSECEEEEEEAHRTHERVVRGDKAEAAGSDLGNSGKQVSLDRFS